MRSCPACGAAYPNQQAICARDGALLIGSKRVPRWVRDPLIVVLTMVIIVAGLALGQPSSNIFKEADELYDAHQYRLSGILLRLACTRGNAVACGNLGLYSREAALLIQACDAGDASSCYEAGGIYERGIYELGYRVPKDYPRAAELFSKACRAGNANGAMHLQKNTPPEKVLIGVISRQTASTPGPAMLAFQTVA